MASHHIVGGFGQGKVKNRSGQGVAVRLKAVTVLLGVSNNNLNPMQFS
jgi:hypothetical protein